MYVRFVLISLNKLKQNIGWFLVKWEFQNSKAQIEEAEIWYFFAKGPGGFDLDVNPTTRAHANTPLQSLLNDFSKKLRKVEILKYFYLKVLCSRLNQIINSFKRIQITYRKHYSHYNGCLDYNYYLLP